MGQMINLSPTEPNTALKSFLTYVRDSRHNLVPDPSSVSLEFLALSNALGGEVGELQNVVKKIVSNRMFFDESDLHGKFILEAGDVLHYLLSIIDIAGYEIEYIMSCNVQKLEARKQAQLEAQEQTAVLAALASQPRA